jgi:hypothetical protein
VATFSNTTSPTPFGFYDARDLAFQTEADAVVTFVKRKLGDDILSVELTSKQIWATLEESTLEFSSILNTYQARVSNSKLSLACLLRDPTGRCRALKGKYPRENLDYLTRFAEPYSFEAGVRWIL